MKLYTKHLDTIRIHFPSITGQSTYIAPTSVYNKLLTMGEDIDEHVKDFIREELIEQWGKELYRRPLEEKAFVRSVTKLKLEPHEDCRIEKDKCTGRCQTRHRYIFNATSQLGLRRYNISASITKYGKHEAYEMVKRRILVHFEPVMPWLLYLGTVSIEELERYDELLATRVKDRLEEMGCLESYLKGE